MMQMFSTIRMKDLLIYPFKQENSANKILIGSLLTFAGSIIPILPSLVVTGYLMKIARRIIDGDGQLSLPEWDNWGEYLKDGFKLFGATFIYTLPIFVIMGFGYTLYFASFMGMMINSNSTGYSSGPETILPFLGMMVLFLTMGIVIILSLIEGLILPPAIMHLVHTGEFSSAFKFKEWWPVLRRNFWGFFISFVFIMGLYYFLMLGMSLLYMTIVLCVLIPLVIAPMGFIMGLWSTPLLAQSYRDGMDRVETIQESL
jgi:hypothetical protein